MPHATTVLYGNLTRDPELTTVTNRKTGEQIARCRLALAMNHGSGPDDVTYFDVVCFGPLADRVFSAKRKGHQVICDVRIEGNIWENGNGETVRGYNFVANNVQYGAIPAPRPVPTLGSEEEFAPKVPRSSDEPIIQNGVEHGVEFEIVEKDGRKLLRALSA